MGRQILSVFNCLSHPCFSGFGSLVQVKSTPIVGAIVGGVHGGRVAKLVAYFSSMMRCWMIRIFATGFLWQPLLAQDEDLLLELQQSSEDHMREELGVNEVTAPQVQKLMIDLESFRPLPMDLIESNNRDASFSNRFQTALHFGSLVADGFVIVIAERPQDVQAIGRALIRQSRSLGVGDNLLNRSKSLIELGDRGDWMNLRQELIETQVEIENAMMQLRDEEMAHMVSFGGWLRGFQLAANSTAENYTPVRAAGLNRLDVMDYFIDRLETLNPRLKRTELVTKLLSGMKTIRAIAAQREGSIPTSSEVMEMRDIVNDMVAASMSQVDAEGRIVQESL